MDIRGDTLLQLFIGILTIAVLGAVFLVVPPAEGLGDYVRLAFFHIPVAWVSVLAFLMSAWWAAAYLRKGSQRVDALSAGSAKIGLIFVLLATVSGAIFSKMTWGAYWNWDPRQTTIFVLLLLYGAYLTLRAVVPDAQRRARVSAVYSLLSCLSVPFLVFVLPRFYFSLHPSPLIQSGGRVDMDPVMLAVLAAGLVDVTCIYFWLLFRQRRENP